MYRHFIWVLTALALGCGKPPVPPPPPDLSAPVPAGQARAGRITKTEELIGGPKAKGRIGDFKIANAKVRFIVGDERLSSGYGPYGGEILDADLARGPGEAGQSSFGELISGFDLRTVHATSVEVIKDGLSGGPAQVRVHGYDDDVPVLVSMIGAAGNSLGADITLDYVLDPDARVLKVFAVLRARGSDPLSVGSAQVSMVMGDGNSPFYAGRGFTNDRSGPMQFWAAAGAKPAVSYGIFAPSSSLSVIFGSLGLDLLNMGEPGQGGGEFRVSYEVAVGEGDVASLMRVQDEEIEKTKLPHLKVRALANGTPVPARFHVTQDGQYAAFARTSADGYSEIPLPPGHYDVQAMADGRDPSAKVGVDLTADGAVAEPQLSASGVLKVNVVEQDAPIPAKLILFRENPPAAPPPSYGEPWFNAGASDVVFLGPEGKELPLAPGSYHVWAQRGFEYDLAQDVVQITANETTPLTLRLTRVVDTTGYLCGDFHIHGAPSPDSDDSFPLKVAAFGAEGIEVPVPTDHEYIADYAPSVEALGLTHFMKTIVGEEVTAMTMGHFNGFPLQPMPELPNAGAVNWFHKTGGEIFAEMRKNPAHPLVQINHPRTSGVLGGYFGFIGFHPDTFTADRPQDFSTDFDVIEVMNGARPASAEEVMVDWFAFLERGMRIAGTGNSDSHYATLEEVGSPRNYVLAGTDEPSQVDPKAFVDAVKAGHMSVSCGPFITLSGNGKGMGELVAPQAGKVTLHVKVQAPPWMGPIETLEVLKNGQILQRVDLTQFDQVVRYEGDFEDSPSADSFYLARVRSTAGNLGPAAPTLRPYAFTNPVYVDVDQDGSFNPPL